MHRRFPSSRASVRGVTLVELMVALTIGMLILLALTVLFSRNNTQMVELEKTGRQLESGRFALDSLLEEARHAGFYGEFNRANLSITYTNPAPCAAGLVDLGWDTATVNVKMPVPLAGVPDASAYAGCLSNAVAGSEAVSFRYVNTGDDIATGALTAGNLYIQVSRCALDVKQLGSGSAAADFGTLRDSKCATPVGYVRKFVDRIYYVATCDDCAGAGDGIPTLKRAEWIDGGWHTTAVAEGVEKLAVEYGVDTNGDGAVDQYTDAATLNLGTAPVVWQAVVDARLHVLSRNTETTTGYTDPRTYTLASLAYKPADAYKRTLLRSTVRITNNIP